MLITIGPRKSPQGVRSAGTSLSNGTPIHWTWDSVLGVFVTSLYRHIMAWPQVLIFAKLKKTPLHVGIHCKEEALNLSTSNWTSGVDPKQALGEDSEIFLWCYKWLKATVTAPSWVGKNRLGPRTAPASPAGFPVSDADSPWPGQPAGLEQGFFILKDVYHTLFSFFYGHL